MLPINILGKVILPTQNWRIVLTIHFEAGKFPDCLKMADMTPVHKNNVKLLTKTITDQLVRCLYRRKYLKKID